MVAPQVLQTGKLTDLAHALPISVGDDEVLVHKPFGGEYTLHMYDRNADLPPPLPPRYASLGLVPSTGLGDPWPGGALASGTLAPAPATLVYVGRGRLLGYDDTRFTLYDIDRAGLGALSAVGGGEWSAAAPSLRSPVGELTYLGGGLVLRVRHEDPDVYDVMHIDGGPSANASSASAHRLDAVEGGTRWWWPEGVTPVIDRGLQPRYRRDAAERTAGSVGGGAHAAAQPAAQPAAPCPPPRAPVRVRLSHVESGNFSSPACSSGCGSGCGQCASTGAPMKGTEQGVPRAPNPPSDSPPPPGANEASL